ncbi:hypothetical protein NJB1907f44_15390 [Mycobacterium marinum]|nr:hypothetical protein MMARE11_15260 [Mycobacterium marinum E11]GJO08439.1 hypothetical protein NJB1808e29_40950 [Mycobacterium marinum]GJO12920.1 hypothetical protein NJB1907f34b_48160 [Mycobacterium marinum]GJO41049.1 hypothetical protein NJB1907E19_28750 [Mycobacterium marinum]GJO42005.1 hypothetical protein NJB1728e24_25180 [Mycobacterium marinum]
MTAVSNSTARAQAALDSFPGPVTMQQPRWVTRLGLAVGVALTFTFLWFVFVGVGDSDPHFPRAAQAFFGTLVFGTSGVLALALSISDLRNPPELVLDKRGFGIIKAHDAQNFRWSAVENFRIKSVRVHGHVIPRVCFDEVETDRTGGQRRDMVSFPNTYGLSRESFCSMMQAWRTAVLNTNRPQSG